MKCILLFVVVLWTGLTTLGQQVVSIKVDGSINPATAAFIKKGIDAATEQQATCLVIQLNTPGGLLKSTRVIVADILASPIPVVVYVSPSGSHAGSAGVFITMAAHVAAMSNASNIGAAHPVSTQGAMDSTMSEKTTNDAAAFIRTIAGKRNRNVSWAEDAVRRSVSITETEALSKNVIDLIATNERDLLRQLDGRLVDINNVPHKLQTQGATILRIEMNALERFLDFISDPSVAYILMMLGFYGLLFELYSPGAVAPGVIGAICLILAFYAMHTLPLNYAGLALIIVSVILFVLEIKIISHGVLGIGGVIALVLGSMMLIRNESALEFLKISWSVILGMAAFTGIFFFALIAYAVKAQRLKPMSGVEAITGKIGEVVQALSPAGVVMVDGALWQAESSGATIERGQAIRITSINNLTLHVEAVT